MRRPGNKPLYADIISRLYGLERRGIKPGLARIRTVLKALGDPQLRYPAVHIAGTNGKGSVAAMLASVLMEAGFKTGLYTSPHLDRFNERIRVDGREMTDAETAAEAAAVLGAAGAERATFFEATTAMAFCHFAKRRVEIAVVETGMGGRWDATNAVTPAVSIITNVAIDHAEYLGPTVSDIAREKAGIIKKGVPVVTAASGAAALVIEGAARAAGSPLYRLGRDFGASKWAPSRTGGLFDYSGPGGEIKRVAVGLAGPHQAANAACALAAAELLNRAGFDIPRAAARRGLKAARWPARLEALSRRPLVLIDAAHNPDGARALAKALKAAFKYKRLVLVLGVLGDKDVDGIFKWLVPLADSVIVAPPATQRAAPAATLLQRSKPHLKRGATATAEGSVADACERALRAADRDDAVVVAGSVYTAGEARKYLLKTL